MYLFTILLVAARYSILCGYVLLSYSQNCYQDSASININALINDYNY